MKVTLKTLSTLRQFASESNPKEFPKHYDIIGEEKVHKTIQRPIPYETGWCPGQNVFSGYLLGFAHCYRVEHHPDWYLPRDTYVLKDEYCENRPLYSVEVDYTLYDIELTKEGKKEVERRYNIHKRNMERYAKLMG